MPMVFHQIFANLMTSWGSFGCFRAAKLLANRYVRNSSSSRFLSPLLAIVLWSKMNELSLSMSKIFEKLYCKIIVVTLYCIENTKNHPSMKKFGPLQNYYGDRSLLLVVQLECFMEAIAGFSPPSFSAVYSSLGSLAYFSALPERTKFDRKWITTRYCWYLTTSRFSLKILPMKPESCHLIEKRLAYSKYHK